MWCPVVAPRKPPQAPCSSEEATPAAATEPVPSTPPPAIRSKRTKAEQAVEPTERTQGKGKAKGKAAKAKPAPQPGRWLDRDCNAALNMQRIGESRWRPLELCYWQEQGKLPAKGKDMGALWDDAGLREFYRAFKQHGCNWSKVSKAAARQPEACEALWRKHQIFLELSSQPQLEIAFIAMVKDHYNNMKVWWLKCTSCTYGHTHQSQLLSCKVQGGDNSDVEPDSNFQSTAAMQEEGADTAGKTARGRSAPDLCLTRADSSTATDGPDPVEEQLGSARQGVATGAATDSNEAGEGEAEESLQQGANGGGRPVRSTRGIPPRNHSPSRAAHGPAGAPAAVSQPGGGSTPLKGSELLKGTMPSPSSTKGKAKGSLPLDASEARKRRSRKLYDEEDPRSSQRGELHEGVDALMQLALASSMDQLQYQGEEPETTDEEPGPRAHGHDRPGKRRVRPPARLDDTISSPSKAGSRDPCPGGTALGVTAAGAAAPTTAAAAAATGTAQGGERPGSPGQGTPSKRSRLAADPWPQLPTAVPGGSPLTGTNQAGGPQSPMRHVSTTAGLGQAAAGGNTGVKPTRSGTRLSASRNRAGVVKAATMDVEEGGEEKGEEGGASGSAAVVEDDGADGKADMPQGSGEGASAGGVAAAGSGNRADAAAEACDATLTSKLAPHPPAVEGVPLLVAPVRTSSLVPTSSSSPLPRSARRGRANKQGSASAAAAAASAVDSAAVAQALEAAGFSALDPGALLPLPSDQLGSATAFPGSGGGGLLNLPFSDPQQPGRREAGGPGDCLVDWERLQGPDGKPLFNKADLAMFSLGVLALPELGSGGLDSHPSLGLGDASGCGLGLGQGSGPLAGFDHHTPVMSRGAGARGTATAHTPGGMSASQPGTGSTRRRRKPLPEHAPGTGQGQAGGHTPQASLQQQAQVRTLMLMSGGLSSNMLSPSFASPGSLHDTTLDVGIANGTAPRTGSLSLLPASPLGGLHGLGLGLGLPVSSPGACLGIDRATGLGQEAGLRLPEPRHPAQAAVSHALSSNRVRRWIVYEWLYPAIDRSWFMRNELEELLTTLNLDAVGPLTRGEWSLLRSAFGRPRRLSLAFLKGERIKLQSYRQAVRAKYKEVGLGAEVPPDVPRPLTVGQQVVARHPVTRQLHDGVILTIKGSKYRVQFHRAELMTEVVADTELMPVSPGDNLPLSLLLRKPQLMNGRVVSATNSSAATRAIYQALAFREMYTATAAMYGCGRMLLTFNSALAAAKSLLALSPALYRAKLDCREPPVVGLAMGAGGVRPVQIMCFTVYSKIKDSHSAGQASTQQQQQGEAGNFTTPRCAIQAHSMGTILNLPPESATASTAAAGAARLAEALMGASDSQLRGAGELEQPPGEGTQAAEDQETEENMALLSQVNNLTDRKVALLTQLKQLNDQAEAAKQQDGLSPAPEPFQLAYSQAILQLKEVAAELDTAMQRLHARTHKAACALLVSPAGTAANITAAIAAITAHSAATLAPGSAPAAPDPPAAGPALPATQVGTEAGTVPVQPVAAQAGSTLPAPALTAAAPATGTGSTAPSGLMTLSVQQPVLAPGAILNPSVCAASTTADLLATTLGTPASAPQLSQQGLQPAAPSAQGLDTAAASVQAGPQTTSRLLLGAHANELDKAALAREMEAQAAAAVVCSAFADAAVVVERCRGQAAGARAKTCIPSPGDTLLHQQCLQYQQQYLERQRAGGPDQLLRLAAPQQQQMQQTAAVDYKQPGEGAAGGLVQAAEGVAAQGVTLLVQIPMPSGVKLSNQGTGPDSLGGENGPAGATAAAAAAAVSPQPPAPAQLPQPVAPELDVLVTSCLALICAISRICSNQLTGSLADSILEGVLSQLCSLIQPSQQADVPGSNASASCGQADSMTQRTPGEGAREEGVPADAGLVHEPLGQQDVQLQSKQVQMHVMHPSSSLFTTTSSVFPTLPLLRYRVPITPRQLSEWNQPGYCRPVQHALTRHSAGELETLVTTVGGDAATEPSNASCLASNAASTAPMREAQADNQSSPTSWDHGLSAWCQHAYSRTPAQLLAERAHIVQSKRASASDVVWSSLGMFCAVYALGTANGVVSALPGVGPWHQQASTLAQPHLNIHLHYCLTRVTQQPCLPTPGAHYCAALQRGNPATSLGVRPLQHGGWPPIVNNAYGVQPCHLQGLGLLLGSFGTICVLLFGRPEAEAIRTWNLVVGHLTSVSVVVCVLGCLGSTVFSRALAMALALASMLLTDSVHPPGGALVLMAMDSRAIQSMQAWFLVCPAINAPCASQPAFGQPVIHQLVALLTTQSLQALPLMSSADPSLAWTFALLLPLGAATNWLKRNVQFQWPSHSSPAPASDDVAPLPIQAASHAELRLKVA
ncbi:hypothetical protein QJQ45_021560 [Haematococcus lacustris]|nr:hypothetical protein QJQ45_021560 [Haematococcus lacustris]